MDRPCFAHLAGFSRLQCADETSADKARSSKAPSRADMQVVGRYATQPPSKLAWQLMPSLIALHRSRQKYSRQSGGLDNAEISATTPSALSGTAAADSVPPTA
jgi:hypothetical protein